MGRATVLSYDRVIQIRCQLIETKWKWNGNGNGNRMERYQFFGEDGEHVVTAHPQVVQHAEGVLTFLRSASEEELGQTGSLNGVVVSPGSLSSQ